MKLCVAITEPDLDGARCALERVAGAGAMAEVRLDCLDAFDPTRVDELDRLCSARPTKIILTWRRARDGGRREVDERDRIRLLVEGARRFADYCDLEDDLSEEELADADPTRLILSHHDMRATPPDLARIYERMTRRPAAFYKIATHAAETADVFAHFDLLARGTAEGRPLVALAMGSKGIPSRILGPAHGGAFTFCALQAGRESAPGQLSLDEMTRLYRVDRIGAATAVTGLVGGRVDYSLSPFLHNAAAVELGLDGVYVPFEVDDLEGFVRDVARPASRRVAWDVRGLSVTNPFKVPVMRHLDWVDPLAERVGAVNTIVVESERLLGYNTDVAGAMAPLERHFGSVAGARAGIVGAGGAARAVACGLAERGARVTIFARRPEQAAEAAAGFGAGFRPLADLAGARLDVLVNASPVGTHGPGEGEMPVEAAHLQGTGLVYDLVYNPSETRLLATARALGCRVLNGLEMLVEQAALQVELWTGRTAPRAVMREAALERLNSA